MNRRHFVGGLAAFGAAVQIGPAQGALPDLPAIEARTGGRLGVFAVDVETGRTIGHRATQRFAMCSTFKFLVAAQVLRRVDAGIEKLTRRIHYTKRDLLEYAPVTRANAARGWMTVGELCQAALDYSDNTAANLLLATLHGPHGVTHFLRTQGDGVTILSRTEPALNTAYAGDVRDTTTPQAMAADMRHFLLGGGLREPSRRTLMHWMQNNTTGATRLRTGLPKTWMIGDKTGTGGGINRHGDSDTRNDIAFAIPPDRKPVFIAAYLTASQLPAAQGDAALADVARYVVRTFGI